MRERNIKVLKRLCEMGIKFYEGKLNKKDYFDNYEKGLQQGWLSCYKIVLETLEGK